MAATFIDPGGLVIPDTALTLRRSREVANALRRRDDLYATLVECRRRDGAEIVVMDVEPNRPQVRAHPIQRVERVALVFEPEDRIHPKVLSLRPDFPLVPHLTQEASDYPRGLCLYEQPWPDVRIGWTAPAFIERIRWWLGETARGRLHGDDQALEALLLSCGAWLVLPRELPAPMTPCAVVPAGQGGPDCRVLVVRELPLGGPKSPVPPNVLLRFSSPPRQHGTSPRAPKTLADVCDLLELPGFNLRSLLRDALSKWPENLEHELGAKIVLLVDLPKTKIAGGPIVATDLKAFLIGMSGYALGAALGVWKWDGHKRTWLLPPDLTAGGQGVTTFVLNVTSLLTPDAAAMFNGLAQSNAVKVAAVGAGALGSQVILNLARAGFGRWTIIDNDHILPHNLARHALAGSSIGYCKAHAVSAAVSSLYSSTAPKAIEADILDPGDHATEIATAITEAEVILDLSASIPVARHLCRAAGGGRRLSVFLSPSGHDLVVLAEDRERRFPLDQLEMSYYAAIASTTELNGHLDPPAGTTRYGLSCRDAAGRIAQADVGMFAGIASGAIQRAVAQDNALIRFWRADSQTGAVRVIDTVPDHFIVHRFGDWTVHLARRALDQIAAWRLGRLPNETGGILFGGIDHDQRNIFVLNPLPSPPDSVEWPTLYIRGNEGMRRAAADILDRSAGHMLYLGEWHSHPRGVQTLPSDDDLIVLGAVDERVSPAGQPGIILIAGDDGRARLFVQRYDKNHPPEELCPH